MCKEGKADNVRKCLGFNPSLLNCLNGEPLRLVVLGRQLGVIEVLMNNTELKVNLRGEQMYYKMFVTNIKMLVKEEH